MDKIDKSKFIDEWILVHRGKVIMHSKKLEDILSDPTRPTEDSYIEKVVEGQVCFY
jgi:hypothetical protein